MLSERERELLTAAVDGELTPQQRRLVRRLLDESPEARRLWRQLHTDARQLRRLAHRQAPSDLSARILLAITSQGLAPRPRVRPLANRWGRLPLTASLVAAASVIGVCLSALAYFATVGSTTPSVAANLAKPAPATTPRSRPQPLPSNIDEVLPQLPVIDDTPLDPSIEDEPAPQNPLPQPTEQPTVITAPPREPADRFEIVQPRLALFLEVASLKTKTHQLALRRELQREDAVRFDVFCKDTHRALDRLRDALRLHGTPLLVDARCLDRLNRKQATAIGVLIEHLTPTEWAALLQTIAAEDTQHSGNEVFGRLVLTPLTAADHRELISLFGVNPIKTRPTRGTGPLGVDISKPLTDQTKNQVAGSLQGPARRQGLAVIHSPSRTLPSMSAEVKLYFEQRLELPGGAVPVLLVLRQPR